MSSRRLLGGGGPSGPERSAGRAPGRTEVPAGETGHFGIADILAQGNSSKRSTKQRSAIQAALQSSERPLTPPEILSEAQRNEPRLGIATVYRALRDGIEAGSIRSVEVPGGATHYERADHGHHHHFHCTRCGKVYEVHGCPGDLAKLAPAGFRVEGHEITLSGVCAECVCASP